MNKIILLGLMIVIGTLIVGSGLYDEYSSTVSAKESQMIWSYGNHPSESCHCVAFRFDDISDYLHEVKIEVINTFYKKQTPLTLGIVGDRFGENEKLLNFIKEKIQDDDFDLEIANHGWEHENFSLLDKDQQSQLIKKTNDKVYDKLGIRPTVFIPPTNRFNSDTPLALHENGMTHFSPSLKLNSMKHYPFSNIDVYQFPGYAATGYLDPESNLVYGHTNEKVFSDLKKSFNKFGFAVVVVHPLDFTLFKDEKYLDEPNLGQFHELEVLIDMIKANGLEIVPISKINSKISHAEPIIEEKSKKIMREWVEGTRTDSDFIDTLNFLREDFVILNINDPNNVKNSQENIPTWFKNNVSWWLEKKTSTNDFVNSIDFLLKNEILII